MKLSIGSLRTSLLMRNSFISHHTLLIGRNTFHLNHINSINLLHFNITSCFATLIFFYGSMRTLITQGGGRGAMPPPQRPDKNYKNGPICSILHYQKKNFPGGMPPDPPNSLICSVFLALATAGPRQCERQEPAVKRHN